MKRFLPPIVLLLFCVTISFAQAPKGINYQGVARDSEGNPLASKSIGVRISILKTSATGEVEYSETHKPTTNQFGLFTLIIGQGTKGTGDFGFISWAVGTKWLQVEVDPNGGSAYTLTGTQQLMSVPYALYAEYTGSSGLSAGQGIAINSGVVSNTGDADKDPTNELQNLSDVLTKSNNAGTLRITNLGTPTAASDAATKNYVDTQNDLDLDKDPTNELQALKDVLTKDNDAGGKQIKNILSPTDPNDAATKNYVDTQNALLDQSATNEIQDLTINTTTNILKITNNPTATNIDLTPYKQNLNQVLTNSNDAGAKKITNLAGPTVNSDATTKLYVDNAIATNYAFKAPYSFTNPGSVVTNQVVSLGTDIYDEFNVTSSNRFVAPSNGYYMFFIDGTVNGNIANIILSVRVNNVDIYQAKKSEERIGSFVFTNHHLNLMVKLAQNDIVELVVSCNTVGDVVSGMLFGYKL